ncbi:MAG: helix-turn-helix domain-containing protein [Actinobacteria bacterium]|nr:helix-turn-helix domain-containing protein [Actinomycetota bacterium]
MWCLHTICCAYTTSVPNRKVILSAFQERLGKVIHDSKMNRSQFAEAVGLDRSTLSQLLSSTNRRLPRIETLTAIAQAQQVSVDWLIGLSNTGPMQAELMNEQMSFEREAFAHNDEHLISWLREAVGYKIRYVPSTLPDLLKTEAVIRYEIGDRAVSSPEQKIETAAARLAWTRGPETDFECCNSIQSIEMFARGAGIWSKLEQSSRVAQLDHMIELCTELYPTLRWFLFDGRDRYASPVTIFGPLRAALYLGQMYLVLTSTEHVRTLTRLFDDLIRGAVVQPPDVPAFLKQQRVIAQRQRS